MIAFEDVRGWNVARNSQGGYTLVAYTPDQPVWLDITDTVNQVLAIHEKWKANAEHEKAQKA